MRFPAPDDFLEEFGICPDCVNESDGFFQYSGKSRSGMLRVTMSFSGVADSFQVCMSIFGEDALVVSSERVRAISIFREASQAGVKVEFDYLGLSAEAKVVLEPEPKVNWWVLSGKES
ncbi:hypothetical protein D3C86_1507300 [compost metagenome]